MLEGGRIRATLAKSGVNLLEGGRECYRAEGTTGRAEEPLLRIFRGLRFPLVALGLCPLVLLVLDLTRHHSQLSSWATLRFGALFDVDGSVSTQQGESLQGRKHYIRRYA